MTITHADWQKALADLNEGEVDTDPSVLTTAELQVVWNMPERTATRKIKLLVENGYASPTKKRIRRVNGSIALVGAYKLKEPLD